MADYAVSTKVWIAHNANITYPSFGMTPTFSIFFLEKSVSFQKNYGAVFVRLPIILLVQ